MKFGLMYANAGPFAFPEMLTHLATTAERCGVESLWVVEHVVIPVGYESTYPYDPSGKIPAPEQVPMPDPLIALAYAAAVTKQHQAGHRHPHPAAAQSPLPRQGGREPRRPVARPDDPRHRHRLAEGGVRRRSASRSRTAPRAPPRPCAPSGRSGSRKPSRSGEVLPLGQGRVEPEAGTAARRTDRRRRPHRAVGAPRRPLR